jgi:hypothetical protein
MSVEISGDMIGMGEANAELERLMAADAAAGHSPAAVPTTDQSVNAGQRAAQPGGKDAKSDSLSQTDTPAATGKAAAETVKQDQSKEAKPSEQAASEAGKTLSRYAKTAQRQEKSWAEINRQKDEVRKERERLETERKQFEEQRRKQEAALSPEQYEAAAKRFEDQGKFDLADAARERAEELRRNPTQAKPQTEATAKPPNSQLADDRKEWWTKAAIDFPNVSKEGTPEHTALKAFVAQEPRTLDSPIMLYYAARMVNAETAAARVPELDKELGALRAKVKELESMTAPSPAGNPPKSGAAGEPGETLDDLERLALEMGPLR